MESNRGRQIDIVEQAEQIVSAYIEKYFMAEEFGVGKRTGGRSVRRMRAGCRKSRKASIRITITVLAGVALALAACVVLVVIR